MRRLLPILVLTAMVAGTGRHRRRRVLSSPNQRGTAIVSEAGRLTLSTGLSVEAHGPATGALVWRNSESLGARWPSVARSSAPGDDRVGFGLSQGRDKDALAVMVDAATGRPALDGAIATSPVLSSDGATAYVGTLYAVDTAGGAVLWTAAVGAAVTQPPALAGDTLLVPTASGSLVALAAGGCGAATCGLR